MADFLNRLANFAFAAPKPSEPVRLPAVLAQVGAFAGLPVEGDDGARRGNRPPRPSPPTPVIGSYAPEAVTLGRLVDPDTGVDLNIRYGGDQHILVFGANGKGKGTRILMPNLLQMQGNRSIVVVDPKGELAAVTAPYRRSLGKVVIFNPYGVLVDIPGYEDLKSCGFNPLARLDPAADSFNEDAAELADALVTPDPKDPHWGQSARALIAAIIMYATIEAKRNGGVPTMSRVRELICLASSEERGNTPATGIPALALAMMEESLAGLSNKASQFTDWNREVQSIASTAKIQTEPFDDPPIARELSTDGFDFRQLKSEPTTVYLILPPKALHRQSKWLRIVLTSAIQAVLRVRRPGEPKVLFMLDEFFALGHLEIIQTVWALVRGYGVALMPILQDMIQLKKLYPEMWENFIGMAGAVISFGPNDLTTADWLSRRAGEGARTVQTSSTSSNTGGSSGSSVGFQNSSQSSGSSWGSSTTTTTSEIKAPVVSGHKLFGLRPGFVLVALDGLSDLIPVYAPAYYDIYDTWLVARDNPYYLG